VKAAGLEAGSFNADDARVLFSLDESAAPKADNVGMNADQIQKYKAFVNDAWDKAVNHKEVEFIPKDEFVLFVDKSGYRHAVTTQRIRHIYRQHGNERAEKSRRQVSITQRDIENIPDIIDNYSFAIKNFTFEGNKAILYAKEGAKNTYTALVMKITQCMLRGEASPTLQRFALPLPPLRGLPPPQRPRIFAK
jgi:hypothetical protein